MPRPYNMRWIGCRPAATLFKPAGMPAAALRVTSVALDELEALRLVDAEGLDQAAAAERMRVSRATVGRILQAARAKVARALVEGYALAIESGEAPIAWRGGPPPGAGRRRGRGWKHGW